VPQMPTQMGAVALMHAQTCPHLQTQMPGVHQRRELCQPPPQQQHQQRHDFRVPAGASMLQQALAGPQHLTPGGGQQPPSTGERNPDIFMKTKMCKFHLLGICSKGSDCQFAHNKDEMNPLPDLYRTKLCKTLINTGQCNDSSCKYAHNREELRSANLQGPQGPRIGGRHHHFLQQSAPQQLQPPPHPLAHQQQQQQQFLQPFQQGPQQQPDNAGGAGFVELRQVDRSMVPRGVGYQQMLPSGPCPDPEKSRSRRRRQGRQERAEAQSPPGADAGASPQAQAGLHDAQQQPQPQCGLGMIVQAQVVAPTAYQADVGAMSCDTRPCGGPAQVFACGPLPMAARAGGRSPVGLADFCAESRGDVANSNAAPIMANLTEQPWLQWWCNQFPPSFASGGEETGTSSGTTIGKPDQSSTSSDSEGSNKPMSPAERSDNSTTGTPPPEHLYGSRPLSMDDANPLSCEQGMAQVVYQHVPQDDDCRDFLGSMYLTGGITIKNTFLELQPVDRFTGLRAVRTADGRLDNWVDQDEDA